MPRILVVEDDPGQLEIRKHVLEHAGYDVVSAENADEGIERLPGCDVIVTDLQIPKPEDGFRLIQAASGRARIIVLSGAPFVYNRPIVDEFLMKPCSSKKLLETIARLSSP